MKVGMYRKLLAAVLALVAARVGVEFDVGTMAEAIIMAIGAFGVWAVPNDRE